MKANDIGVISAVEKNNILTDNTRFLQNDTRCYRIITQFWKSNKEKQRREENDKTSFLSGISKC